MAKGKKNKKSTTKHVEATVTDLPSERTTPIVAKQRRGPSSQFLISHINKSMAGHAAFLLGIATCIALALGFAMFGLEGGRVGVPAMGGVGDVQIPLHSAQVILFLDIIFPIAFGSGFALLTTSMQSRGNRPLVRLILTAVLVAVVSDFLENALVYSTMIGEEPYLLRWPLTVVKYSGLAFAAVMLSAVMPIVGLAGNLVHLLIRFVFPLAIAVIISGLGGQAMADAAGATFPVTLFMMAIYARQLSSTRLR